MNAYVSPLCYGVYILYCLFFLGGEALGTFVLCGAQLRHGFALGLALGSRVMGVSGCHHRITFCYRGALEIGRLVGCGGLVWGAKCIWGCIMELFTTSIP